MMKDPNGIVLAVVLLFVIMFAALTFVALLDAAPTLGSVVSFGLAFLVLGLVAVGIIGAIRNPPDE